MTTLGNRLQDRSENNLDFLRFLAALMVIFSHCFGLLGYSQDPLHHLTGWETFGSLGLRIFFFMSGMLVTGSWCNASSTLAFVRKRVLRIFPGLAAAVLFCTLVIGPLSTVYTPVEYFAKEHTYRYLLNAFLPTIAYGLPGVFVVNPNHAVNGSLWTLPYELLCYLAVMICGKLRLLTTKIFPLTAVGLLALIVCRRLEPGGNPLVDGHFRLGSLELCEIEFLLGMAAYLYRQSLPINRWLAALVLMAYLGTIPTGTVGQFVALFAVPYLILYLAQVRIPRLGRWARYGDLSYGMYIYAFPIQQLCINTFDVDIGVARLFVLSVALTAGIAYFSWHWVERPTITLRWVPRRQREPENVTALTTA